MQRFRRIPHPLPFTSDLFSVLPVEGVGALATFGHEPGRLRGDGGGQLRAPNSVVGCGEHPAGEAVGLRNHGWDQ